MPKKVTGYIRKRLRRLLEKGSMMDKDIAKKLKISLQTISIYKRKWNLMKRDIRRQKIQMTIKQPNKNHVGKPRKNHVGRPNTNGIIKIDRIVKRIIIELN